MIKAIRWFLSVLLAPLIIVVATPIFILFGRPPKPGEMVVDEDDLGDKS